MPHEFDIFISYGHDDADTAACLASRLDDEGFRCFLAEKDIRPGDQWEPRIRDALIASERILVLITPNSKDSKWVNAEAGAAWALDKPLIPALMFVKPDEVIELISKHQACPVHNQTEIDRFVADLKTVIHANASSVGERSSGVEEFTEPHIWRDLLKIGTWTLDEPTRQIAGKGTKTYLLSHKTYGPAFTISATIRFAEQQPKSRINNVNAGIVFGWQTATENPRYYHIMFTGDKLVLELVGGRGGAEYGDFHHLANAGRFLINDATDYSIRVQLRAGTLTVTVDDIRVLETDQLPISSDGRVGLRPWRSRIICSRFEVRSS